MRALRVDHASATFMQHHAALVAWAKANGLDPEQIAAPSVIEVDRNEIRYEVYTGEIVDDVRVRASRTATLVVPLPAEVA